MIHGVSPALVTVPWASAAPCTVGCGVCIAMVYRWQRTPERYFIRGILLFSFEGSRRASVRTVECAVCCSGVRGGGWRGRCDARVPFVLGHGDGCLAGDGGLHVGSATLLLVAVGALVWYQDALQRLRVTVAVAWRTDEDAPRVYVGPG